MSAADDRVSNAARAETTGETADQQEAQQQEAQQTADGGKADLSIEDARNQIAELEKQLQEEKNRYLYLYSDIENQRRRAVKERVDLQKYGWEPVARELLEVIDNIERALEHMPSGTDHALVEGLHMVMNQFLATLDKHGVRRVEAIGRSFDPNLHEAVAQEPSDLEQGMVTKEFSRGYLLHDRLLRPSKVVVSSGQK